MNGLLFAGQDTLAAQAEAWVVIPIQDVRREYERKYFCGKWHVLVYSRHPLNPYLSGRSPGYGLWGGIAYENVSACQAP